MKAADVAVQLMNRIPQLTDKFTDDLTVTSVVRAGTTLTITTSTAHGLLVNRAVALTGALTPIPLASLTRSGAAGTLVTTTPHDLTEPVTLNPNTRTTVVLSGSIEAEFNGEFTFLTVPNRKTVTFTMPDSGAVTATGSPIIENGESALNTYSKSYRVETIPSTTTFTVTESNTTLPDPVGILTLRKNPRISIGVSPERLENAYTKNAVDKYWMFVVLGAPIASKDRSLSNDAVTNLTTGNEYRQQVDFPFTVFVFIPTASAEIAAGKARDEAAELLTILCQSLLGHQFPTNTAIETQGSVHYLSDDVQLYNTAFLMHAYNFSQVSDLIFEDTVGPDVDVAFRDIDFDTFINIEAETPLSTSKLESSVDLDDVPLP